MAAMTRQRAGWRCLGRPACPNRACLQASPCPWLWSHGARPTWREGHPGAEGLDRPEEHLPQPSLLVSPAATLGSAGSPRPHTAGPGAVSWAAPVRPGEQGSLRLDCKWRPPRGLEGNLVFQGGLLAIESSRDVPHMHQHTLWSGLRLPLQGAVLLWPCPSSVLDLDLTGSQSGTIRDLVL